MEAAGTASKPLCHRTARRTLARCTRHSPATSPATSAGLLLLLLLLLALRIDAARWDPGAGRNWVHPRFGPPEVDGETESLEPTEPLVAVVKGEQHEIAAGSKIAPYNCVARPPTPTCGSSLAPVPI